MFVLARPILAGPVLALSVLTTLAPIGSVPARAAGLPALPGAIGAEHRHDHEAGSDGLVAADFEGVADDVILWGDLARARVSFDRNSGRFERVFLPPVRQLDGRIVTLLGFISTPEANKPYHQFLLSEMPFLCEGCHAAPSPVGIVEVNLLEPITGTGPVTRVTIVVRGRFALIEDDSAAVAYRLDDAVVVPRSGRGPARAAARPTSRIAGPDFAAGHADGHGDTRDHHVDRDQLIDRNDKAPAARD